MMLISSSYTFWGSDYFDRLKKEGEFPANEEPEDLAETLPIDWQLTDNQFLVGIGRGVKRDQVQIELN